MCCRFNNAKSAAYQQSQIQDNSVAAAESSSTILTNEGYVVRVPSNQYLPVRSDTVDTPVVSTPRPQAPTTRYVPPQTTPRYEAPTTPRYEAPTTRYVPPVTTRYEAPTTRYVPPQTTTPRYIPPSTTTTYLPPDANFGQPSNDDVSFLKPSTERPAPVPSSPRPTPPRPTPQRPTYRPSVTVQDENIILPVGCSAAMNCTPVEYCTATGIISKTPVVLTPEQELFRVPMTDCRNPETGAVGKCCRDSEYVDPWPASQLGQYNAEILGFDDGSYKPERRRRNQGQFGAQLSSPSAPAGASSNKVSKRAPAPSRQDTNVAASQSVSVRQPVNQQNRPVQDAARPFQSKQVEQRAVPAQQIVRKSQQQQSCGVRNYVS